MTAVAPAPGEILVITGMSGAGRSTVADRLEDLGWFVIDNLPASLLAKIGELAAVPGSTQRLGLVVRPASYDHDLATALDQLRRNSPQTRLVFLDAPADVLVRRYEDTRRRHPFFEPEAGGGVAEAVERERAVLEPLQADADVVVDTGDLNVHQLRQRVDQLFADEPVDGLMRTTVTSFGYKHGLPRDVDVVIDCRFLPNPHWVPELRPLTGQDAPVRDYLFDQDITPEFVVRLESMLDLLMPAYAKEGKAYLNVALGCTGGRHRSVAMAEHVADWLRSRGHRPVVRHRDLSE